MAYRRRGIGDFIPTSGEGRALVEVKGKVGGKMRGRYKGRYSRFTNKSDQAKWWTASFDNVNWGLMQPDHVVQGIGNAVGPYGTMNRYCHWSAEQLGADEVGQSIFIKRLHIKLAAFANIPVAIANGTRVQNNGSVRDDIPMPGGSSDPTNGQSGALLNGGIAQGANEGTSSWAEGQVLAWYLLYETQDEAGTPLDTLYPDGYEDSSLQKRNRTIGLAGPACCQRLLPSAVAVERHVPRQGRAHGRWQSRDFSGDAGV